MEWISDFERRAPRSSNDEESSGTREYPVRHVRDPTDRRPRMLDSHNPDLVHFTPSAHPELPRAAAWIAAFHGLTSVHACTIMNVLAVQGPETPYMTRVERRCSEHGALDRPHAALDGIPSLD